MTGGGTDRGGVVLGRAVAAQVKYTSKPVGRPKIQELNGAAGGRLTAFFARSGFSAQAVEEADQTGMALFRISLPMSAVPVNLHARRMSGLD